MMRRMKKITALLGLIGMVGSLTSALGYDDNDKQLWLKFSASGKLMENGLTATVEEEIKFGDDMGEQYDEETIMLLSMPTTDWLKIGLGYRAVQERKNKSTVATVSESDGEISYSKIGDGDHYWVHEDRPTLDFVFHKKVEGWKLEDRVRIEYRMKDGSDDYFRYRNRIKVKTPWKLSELKFNPWAAWELNYEDESGKYLDRHRIYAGVGMSFTDIIKGGVYYCLQLDDKDGWQNTHALGLELGAKF